MAMFVNNPKNSTLVHQSNYVKILRVIPFIRAMHCEAQIWARTPAHHVEIHILEVTRYTTTFSFLINYAGAHQWLPQMHITIRCYHDARVAEVVKFQKHKQFDARYSYPNPHMHQRNEKQQINRFLGEWMSYCLKSGCSFRPSEMPIDA